MVISASSKRFLSTGACLIDGHFFLDRQVGGDRCLIGAVLFSPMAFKTIRDSTRQLDGRGRRGRVGAIGRRDRRTRLAGGSVRGISLMFSFIIGEYVLQLLQPLLQQLDREDFHIIITTSEHLGN